MPDLVKYTIRIDGFDVHYNLYRKLDLNPEITLNQFGELIAVLFNRKPDQKFIITNYRDEVLFRSSGSHRSVNEKAAAINNISILEDNELCPFKHIFISYPDKKGWRFDAELEKVKITKRRTPDRLSQAKGVGLFDNVASARLLDGAIFANPDLAEKLSKEQLCELTRRVNTLCPSLSLACTSVKAGEKLDDNALQKALKNMTLFPGKKLHQGYVIDVHLRGSRPSSHREFFFSADTSLNSFIQSVLRQFNADLTHLYSLTDTYGRKVLVCESSWGDEYQGDPNMSLHALIRFYGGQFLLVYDFGDNWEFIVTVQGEGFHKSSEDLLYSQGGGIIEDCGGVWALNQIRSRSRSRSYYSNLDIWDDEDEDENE